jgi:hypothetical protein
MRPVLCPNFCLVLGLSAVVALVTNIAAADDSARPPAPARTEAVPPPLPPISSSPIESFRQLLAMKPAERAQALTNRSAEVRNKILAKIQDYVALKPDERELRLRTTEVEWYFLQLRPVMPSVRQLQSIPDADRQMVESRLAIWDRLSAEQQQQVIKYMPLLNWHSPPPPIPGAPQTSAEAQSWENFNRKLDDWQKLPSDQRRDIYIRFKEFFALNGDERDKTLHLLSEPERAQIEKALAKFDQVPPLRRQRILATWARLEAMSNQEREEFVRNADHWQAMTPAERQTLRALFTQLPPPMPPMPPNFPPMPPKPSGAGARRSQVTLAGTNADLPQ